MADGAEPTNGELSRRLDTLSASLAQMVGRGEYIADQRGIGERFENVTRRMDDIRRELAEDIRAVRDDAKQAREARQGWRTIIYTGLIPALVVLLSILVQIWLAHKGGK